MLVRGTDSPSEAQDGSQDQPLESSDLDILDQMAKPETADSDASSQDNGQTREQQPIPVDEKAITERIRRELQSQHDKELAAQQKAALAEMQRREAAIKAEQERLAQEAADEQLDDEDLGKITRQRKVEATEREKQQAELARQREALVQESNEALRNAEYAALPKEAWPLLQKAEADCHTPAEFVAAARKVHVDHLLAKERAKLQALDTDVSIRDTTAAQAEIAAPVTSTGIPRTSTRVMSEDDYLNEGVAEMRTAEKK